MNGFDLRLEHLERGPTSGAVALSGPKRQGGTLGKERRDGTLAGPLLAIVLQRGQDLEFGVLGVFFSACSWKKRRRRSGATLSPCGGRRAASWAKLSSGCLICSTNTRTAAWGLNADEELVGEEAVVCSRCRRLREGSSER